MGNEQWNINDVGDQSGRVAIVTGANSGLGFETSQALAGRGASVVLAVRNLESGREAVDAIRAEHRSAEVELLELDLASLSSIRRAASEVGNRLDRIDLLINNAGVMRSPQRTTADGFEMQFGTNHLGHFAWTGLLLERLLTVEGSRVVTVSSVAHRMRSRIDFDHLKAEHRTGWYAAYGRSKLANLLFTYELQRRLQAAGSNTAALAAHPGWSDTAIIRDLPGAELFRPLYRPLTHSAAMGALATLRAATDPVAQGGQYYGPDGFRETRGHPVVVASNDASHDTATQRRLWAVSEEMAAVQFPV